MGNMCVGTGKESGIHCSWISLESKPTHVRYGKAKGGLVGKTLSEEQVAGWTLSYHLCNTLSIAFDKMHGDIQEEDVDATGHKEEGKRRKQLDASDRNAIILEVKKYTNPLIKAGSYSDAYQRRLASD